MANSKSLKMNVRFSLWILTVMFVRSIKGQDCPPDVTNWTYFGTNQTICGDYFSICPKENVLLEIGEMAYAECVVKTDVIRTEYCFYNNTMANLTCTLLATSNCKQIFEINVVFYKPSSSDTNLYFYIPGATDVNNNTNIKCIAQNDSFSGRTDVDSRTVFFRVTTESSDPSTMTSTNTQMSPTNDPSTMTSTNTQTSPTNDPFTMTSTNTQTSPTMTSGTSDTRHNIIVISTSVSAAVILLAALITVVVVCLGCYFYKKWKRQRDAKKVPSDPAATSQHEMDKRVPANDASVHVDA